MHRFRGAQAACLHSSAACRRDEAFEELFGKLPKRAGWQPALPNPPECITRVRQAHLKKIISIRRRRSRRQAEVRLRRIGQGHEKCG